MLLAEDSKINARPPWFKPCLQVELESEDPLSASKLKISGENDTPLSIYSLVVSVAQSTFWLLDMI